MGVCCHNSVLDFWFDLWYSIKKYEWANLEDCTKMVFLMSVCSSCKPLWWQHIDGHLCIPTVLLIYSKLIEWVRRTLTDETLEISGVAGTSTFWGRLPTLFLRLLRLFWQWARCLNWISSGIEVVITRTIRNRLTVDPVRGFESHPLRQDKLTGRQGSGLSIFLQYVFKLLKPQWFLSLWFSFWERTDFYERN